MIVVNPDHSIAKSVKDICNFKGEVVKYDNLMDYLQNINLDRIQILERSIKSGQILIKILKDNGIPLNGALWAQVVDDDKLKLFIICATEESNNILKILRSTLSKINDISANQVEIIGPDNGLVQRLKRASNTLSDRESVVGAVEFKEGDILKRVDVKHMYYLNDQKEVIPPIPINVKDFPLKL